MVTYNSFLYINITNSYYDLNKNGSESTIVVIRFKTK